MTNDSKQGESKMLWRFEIPSYGTHKDSESSLRDFPAADICQNRVNLKLEITGHWDTDTLMRVVHQCAILTCVNYLTDINVEKVITVNPSQACPQDYINEFIIRKLNPLIVVDFRFMSAFLHA